MGRRTSACVPVMKTRPDGKLYLSSSPTWRTGSEASMSPGILPASLSRDRLGLEPAGQRFAHLHRPLERREVAAILHDPQACPGDSAGHLFVALHGSNRVLPAAEHQRRARDGREERQAVGSVHDGPLLANEGIAPRIP